MAVSAISSANSVIIHSCRGSVSYFCVCISPSLQNSWWHNIPPGFNASMTLVCPSFLDSQPGAAPCMDSYQLPDCSTLPARYAARLAYAFAAAASCARRFSFFALLSSFRCTSSAERCFLCFFVSDSGAASPFNAPCFLFSFLEGRLSSPGIPSPAGAGVSPSLSEFPSVPASPVPKPIGRNRIFRPFNCGRGARMVDLVMDAAASEPVFCSACFVLRCGSVTVARRCRLCAMFVLTRDKLSVTMSEINK